jgi:hypothetical protein
MRELLLQVSIIIIIDAIVSLAICLMIFLLGREGNNDKKKSKRILRSDEKNK